MFAAWSCIDAHHDSKTGSDKCAVVALQVALFIGNLTQELRDEQTLHTELSKHGRLERLFVAKAADGSHKVNPACQIAEHCRPAPVYTWALWGCGAF